MLKNRAIRGSYFYNGDWNNYIDIDPSNNWAMVQGRTWKFMADREPGRSNNYDRAVSP